MSRLSSRVTVLERVEEKGRGTENMWVHAEAEANLFKQALREHSHGDVNALRAWRDRQTPKHTGTGGEQALMANVSERAANFISKFAAMASRNDNTEGDTGPTPIRVINYRPH